jgi:PelA/Pel-15E family pectate lyase
MRSAQIFPMNPHLTKVFAQLQRFSFALLALSPLTISAAIIGTNPPAQPLTMERIEALPTTTQEQWKDYLQRSLRQKKTDQNFLLQEMRENGITNLIVPKESRGVRSMPLKNRKIWYSSADARRIADNIVSFQTPAGGWSKNFDLSVHPRALGEHFGPGNRSLFTSSGDFDTPNSDWNYIGTFDNDATTTQLRFLALVIAGFDGEQPTKYRKPFLRGLDYIFAAQYPNGGWPQVWPLQGAYHDSVTFNDNAMIKVLELLRDVAAGANEFSFVPEEIRQKAAASLRRGTDCVLAAQVTVNGRRTAWAQQYDVLTLQPDSARNYEMPSIASGESAGVMLYLMQIPNPSVEIIASVHAAAEWFEKTKLMGVAFKSTGSTGRHLVSEPGNGPIWARYYEIVDDQPIFGDRDKSIHDTVEEISFERRKGYSWFTDTGKRALQHYAKWSKAHPQSNHAK